VALSLVPLVVLGASAELGVRLLGWVPNSSPPDGGLPLMAHPTRMWGLSPGAFELQGAGYTVGENGLRQVEEGGAPHRILTLGDSSIFGHGVSDDDTLHRALGDALGEAGVTADVLCGGVPGYSTLQAQVLLDEVGWGLAPDLLVLGGLWSDNNEEFFEDAVWLEALGRSAWQLEFFLDRSHAWRWLRRRAVPPGEPEIKIGWIREPTDVKGRRVALSRYARAVDEILLEAAERGVGVVVLAPSNRARLRRDRGLHPWEDYFAAMERVASRRGALWVDASSGLRAAGLEPDEAFLDEMHPTGDGNRAIAAGLATSLATAGWPKVPLVPDAGPPVFEERLDDTWINGAIDAGDRVRQ
jgi:lysophospholipase L1-like esterase